MRLQHAKHVGVLAASLVLVASGLPVASPAGGSVTDRAAVAAEHAEQTGTARVPKRFKVIQLNLCLHQVNHDDHDEGDGDPFDGCFDYAGSGGPFTPVRKRREAIKVINKRDPNAVTLNEMCRNDLRAIARRTSMKWRFRASEFDAGRCGNRRGAYGIALLARRFDGPKVDDWYYHDGTQRRGMCARTAGKVLLCTTHLEPDSPAGQCRRLRKHLANRKFPVVFGGDVNRQGEPHPCRRKRKMWGLSDHKSTKNTAGLQHVYVTRFGYPQRGGRGRVLGMRTTDHPAFLVTMRRRR